MKRQLKLYLVALSMFGIAGFLTVKSYEAWKGDHASYAAICLAMAYPCLVIGTYALKYIKANISGQRMYTRPDAVPETTLAYAARSVLVGVSYTTKEVDLVTIPFNTGEKVTIDLAELWLILRRAKQRKQRGVLGWTQCVVKENMPKQTWLAYRTALLEAGAVQELGSKELRLIVEPWRAVELVRLRFSYRGWWQAVWGNRKKAKQTEKDRTSGKEEDVDD